jgi:hypothetical protein
MKSFVAFLSLTAGFLNANAQTNNSGNQKKIDPPFVNQIYYYHADSLTALEKNEARVKSKTKALGYGGSESGLVMENEKSNIRIQATDTLRFAVKIGMMMADPSMMIKLYRFTAKKGNRESVFSSEPGTFSKATSTDNEIVFSVQKSGNDTFILIPDIKLSPGEYGFMNMMMINGGGMKMAYTVFALGID